MRASIAILTLLALLAPAQAVAAPAEPLGHAGRWITDADGKVVVLHGFNTVPFDETIIPLDMGMGPDNAEWLAANGFNTIRLGLFYARVEPQPGVYDEAYLDDFLRVQDELAEEGIFTLLDMHQDQLHGRYGPGGADLSRGFPDWFLKEDGLPNTANPYPQGYFTNPALNRAYDNIWQDFDAADGISVQDHYAEGWQRVAEAFMDRPGLLGYDFFNEPWPGTPAASCANPAGCPPGGFDQTLLTDFNRKLVGAIRETDPEHLIFYEPNLQFDFGAQTQVGDPGDENAGFTFHDYCLNALIPGTPSQEPCAVGEELVLDNAEAHVEGTGDALLASELGFDVPAAKRLTQMMDEHMMSWQWWDYYGDLGIFYPDAERFLIRPYPQLVAGTPLGWSFDPETKLFDLRYSPDTAEGEGAVAGTPGAFPAGSVTEVFVPDRHYPDGYGVALSGAEVVSEPDAPLLELASCAGASEIAVQVAPGSETPGRCSDPEPACAFRIVGGRHDDRLTGTGLGERMSGRTGDDRLRGRGGDDCIRGARGHDRLRGGAGSDRLRGGLGADTLRAVDGAIDVVDCGRGFDVAHADAADDVTRCERLRVAP